MKKWKIKCPNIEKYEEVKFFLNGIISYKQKEINKPIKIKENDSIKSADLIWQLIDGCVFTLYEKDDNENYKRICSQKTRISGIEFDSNYELPESDDIDYIFKY